jgi:hypothetical protein
VFKLFKDREYNGLIKRGYLVDFLNIVKIYSRKVSIGKENPLAMNKREDIRHGNGDTSFDFAIH